MTNPSPRQLQPELTQVLAAALVVRHDPPERLPVVPSVPEMPQVNEFVDDNVVDESHRRLDDAPVQTNRPAIVAAPPPLLLGRDDDPGIDTPAFDCHASTRSGRR